VRSTTTSQFRKRAVFWKAVLPRLNQSVQEGTKTIGPKRVSGKTKPHHCPNIKYRRFSWSLDSLSDSLKSILRHMGEKAGLTTPNHQTLKKREKQGRNIAL